MALKRRHRKAFSKVTLDEIRILNNLIPFRMSEKITERSDKLAIAVIRKFFGVDWIERYITAGHGDDFLSIANDPPLLRETRQMRRVLFAEMLFNLQTVKGFRSCLVELSGGKIESTYAALEIARMLKTTATDKKLSFRFVTPSSIKKRDYDLSIKFGDGTCVRAETKCKQEDTKITLKTIEKTFSDAKKQLPQRVPGIVFVKIPRHWIDDEIFAEKMHKLAERSMARSPWIVSVKYYTANIVRETDANGEGIGEIVAFREHTNDHHKFRKYRNRNWHMFPTTGPIGAPPLQRNYNGLPTWQRLFVRDNNLDFPSFGKNQH